MKEFVWDSEKNKHLRETRGVGFEDILFSVSAGGLLDDIEHPNKLHYPNQRLLVVDVLGYAYLIPYIEMEQSIFWKTIIPSRKMTRKYLGR